MTSSENAISLAVETRIDQLCDQFEETWPSTGSQCIEQFVEEFVAEPDRSVLFRRLLEVDLELFARGDLHPSEADYLQRFPEFAAMVTDVFLQFRARQAQSAAPRGEAPTISICQADTSSVPSNLTPTPPMPTRIGRFEVIEILGRGGFGTVYRARDPQMGRDVAIKVPGANRLPTPTDTQRFVREAKAAAALRHANVCAVHEIGEDNGHPFIVMDCIAGEPLSAIIERSERLPVERIVQIIRELALALECIHRQGIIHRDLKPANVIIDGTGTPVIMDFGLARLQAIDDNAITLGGDILGTPAYMPLEQAQGDVQAIGPASDVYSLGAILYELLCGRRPYHGSGSETICQILHAAPPRPSAHDPRVDRRLEAICLKAMARSASQRYPSMAEFAAALSEFSETLNDHRRPLYRRTGWVAAAILFIAIAATVTYIRTDQGWLQIESLDDAVQLVVTQGGREVTIIDTKTQSRVRLHSGEYEIKLQGDRNDVRLSHSSFAMTRGEREIVSVERISAASPLPSVPNDNAANSEVVPVEAPRVASELTRRAAEPDNAEWHGDWRLEGDVLVQDKVGKAFMQFGDSRWTDYDVQVEMLALPGLPDPQGGTINFRGTSLDDHYCFTIGSFGGTATDLTKIVAGQWARVGHFHRVPFVLEQWYTMRVEVRGTTIRCFTDGVEIFNCTDDSRVQGMIGLETWNSRVKWRNLTVTDPDGKLLWEGFPDVGLQQDPPATDEQGSRDAGIAHLKQVLTTHSWLYHDSLYPPPPGDKCSFRDDGTFHKWRWKYWVVGPREIRVHYSGETDPNTGVLFTFNEDLTNFTGTFTSNRGKHVIRGTRQ